MNVLDWLSDNWIKIVVPLGVFLAFLIIAFWSRGFLFNTFGKWMSRIEKAVREQVLQSFRTPFMHWILILGAYVAIQISVLPDMSKVLGGRILFSLFIVSLFWSVLNLIEKLLPVYLKTLGLNRISVRMVINVIRIVFIVTGVLVLLDIWGAPTTPLLLIIAAIILVLIVSTRELLLNIFSGFELARGDVVKVGDYIKLSTGEQGYVVDINWRNTLIKSLDDSVVVIPNSKILQQIITNYGRPLKRATQPFTFYSRLHLKELTGKKARNLRELLDCLREMPDSVIYYHTHHFLEEHQFLIPEPTNDFALWVGDVLDDNILAEKLANIDTFEFNNISELKQKFINVISDYLANYDVQSSAPEGREFHFIRSISVIIPTSYIAHDLREFVEILRKVTIDSLYFHTFESRLRLEKGVNDFSAWFRDCLGENDLASQIAYMDPYNMTLEQLRTSIIQLVEKRIK